MSAKVEGFAPRIPVPTAAPTATVVTPAVDASVAPAATPNTAPVATSFDPSAPAKRLSTEAGAAVSTSAPPASLWGDGDRRVHGRGRGDNGQPVDPAQIAEWKAKRDATAGEINQKVDHLKEKWRYTKDTTKANELWRYAHDSQKMDPATRANLESKLHKCDHDQAKLDHLQAQAKALGPDGGTPEQRTQLAHDIESAKKAVTADLDDANKVISDAGLTDDHLAHAESTIDPNAPPGPSLSDLMSQFFSYCSYIEVNSFIDDVDPIGDMIDDHVSDSEDADRLNASLASASRLANNRLDKERDSERSSKTLLDAIKNKRGGVRDV